MPARLEGDAVIVHDPGTISLAILIQSRKRFSVIFIYFLFYFPTSSSSVCACVHSIVFLDYGLYERYKRVYGVPKVTVLFVVCLFIIRAV